MNSGIAIDQRANYASKPQPMISPMISPRIAPRSSFGSSFGSIGKTIAIALTLVALSACGSKDVKESDRNQDGTYDGNWAGEIGRTPDQVLIENWRVSCWNMAGDLRLNVNDGKARLLWRGFNQTGFVGDKGNFRILISYKDSLKSNSANVSSLTKGLNFIVEGSLAKQSGSLTLGYEDFANQGCRSKVKFSKS